MPINAIAWSLAATSVLLAIIIVVSYKRVSYESKGYTVLLALAIPTLLTWGANYLGALFVSGWPVEATQASVLGLIVAACMVMAYYGDRKRYRRQKDWRSKKSCTTCGAKGSEKCKPIPHPATS